MNYKKEEDENSQDKFGIQVKVAQKVIIFYKICVLLINYNYANFCSKQGNQNVECEGKGKSDRGVAREKYRFVLL